MSNKLKAITTKAKALYKSGKYSKWTDAIKAASKTLTSTKKSVKVSGVKKKAAPKKKTATKKAAVRNYGSHKDTASHNVKISVMSGDANLKHIKKSIKIIEDHYLINLNEYNKYKKLIEEETKMLHNWEWRLKNEFSPNEKKAYRHDIKIFKTNLKEYKFLMNYHKKHLKAKL